MMLSFQKLLTDLATWMASPGYLLFPLLITVWIAWGDIKTHRIPNYLTLGTALAGLAYQGGFHGLPGLADGGLGLGLGFALLIVPYLMGGMGAGDVKALAALGAWLGPWLTFKLFIYMAVAGGILAVGVLWWRGLLWDKIRRAGVYLVSWVLLQPSGQPPPASSAPPTPGIPYGVALALGMLILYWRG